MNCNHLQPFFSGRLKNVDKNLLVKNEGFNSQLSKNCNLSKNEVVIKPNSIPRTAKFRRRAWQNAMCNHERSLIWRLDYGLRPRSRPFCLRPNTLLFYKNVTFIGSLHIKYEWEGVRARTGLKPFVISASITSTLNGPSRNKVSLHYCRGFWRSEWVFLLNMRQTLFSVSENIWKVSTVNKEFNRDKTTLIVSRRITSYRRDYYVVPTIA